MYIYLMCEKKIIEAKLFLLHCNTWKNFTMYKKREFSFV